MERGALELLVRRKYGHLTKSTGEHYREPASADQLYDTAGASVQADTERSTSGHLSYCSIARSRV